MRDVSDERRPRAVFLAGVGERLGTGLARAFAAAGDRFVEIAGQPPSARSHEVDVCPVGRPP
ncbi:hypothetical protein BRC97_07580 [Halobacteriales archaeon QS_6_71_20]|nr:MAG: hypothetical protein BRC97_07580 [Halobacteriales archaeon QS_6_71_20]